MEVPREPECCSFEVLLVYCWPFWFNLYHQRALLNYWQFNLFSLGHRNWVNTFFFFFCLFFFSFIFFLFSFLKYFFLSNPDGSTSVKHDVILCQGICRPPVKQLFRLLFPKTAGWRATNHMEWFCSPFQDKMTSSHPVGSKWGSAFSRRPIRHCKPNSGWFVGLFTQCYYYYYKTSQY